MARGRMLNQSYAEDKLLAELVDEHGTDAGLIYFGLIPFQDRDGRMHGNPYVIKGRCWPRVDRITVEMIDKAVAACHAKQLLVRYEHDGDVYICFPNFRKNQAGARLEREAASQIPQPPDDLIKQWRRPREAALAKNPIHGPPSQDTYFIRGHVTGLIKIGRSVSPVNRLTQLAAQGSEGLDLLAVGGDEADLHRELAAHRVHGEWFKPSPDVMGAVRRYGGDPEAPLATASYDGRRVSVDRGSGAGPEPVRSLDGELPEPLPLNGKEEKGREGKGRPAAEWKDGDPIASVDHLQRAASSWGWAVEVKHKDRTRAMSLYPILPHEIFEQRPKTEAKVKAVNDYHKRVAFFLGCVDTARRDAEAEAGKPQPPGARAPPSQLGTAWKEIKHDKETAP